MWCWVGLTDLGDEIRGTRLGMAVEEAVGAIGQHTVRDDGGSYQMESETGERFDIEIPTFSLDRPNQGVLLN